MRFGSHNVGPIGIDIGARAIRVLQLRRDVDHLDADNLQVVAAACLRMRPDESRDPEYVRTRLAELLSTNKFVGASATTCLPFDELRVKNLRLPKMPEQELAAAVQFEAREKLADCDPDAVIRFIPAGLVGTGDEQQNEVIVLFVRPDVVDARLKLLTELGLTVEGIEPPANATFRPFERFLQRSSDADVAHAFVDVGTTSSRIIITRGANIVFMKTCPVGGQQFDDLTARHLRVATDDAPDARHGLLTGGASAEAGEMTGLLEAIVPAIERLGKEIALCLRYYSVTFRGSRPRQIHCVGGVLLERPVIDRLAEVVQIPVELGGGLRGVESEGLFDERARQSDLAEWTAAMGLALKRRRGAQRSKVA